MSTTSVSKELEYQNGFGNEFSSEALPGALPIGLNLPQNLGHFDCTLTVN